MMYRRKERGELGVGIPDNTALLISSGGLMKVVRENGVADTVITTIHYRNGNKSARTLSPIDKTFTINDLLD